MLYRSTIQLLRFHFSFFLLPVYLFALSQLPVIAVEQAILVFFILHLLVYPASNGYNSYMDRDETPIGGLKHPMQPTRQLFVTTVVLDILALLLGLLVSGWFCLCILFYILASRAYSYRGIRLKRFPITGFLTVFIFQGGLIFFATWHGAHPGNFLSAPLLPCFISSLLIGASYPLTQVYQHREDAADGVTTLSQRLGKRGTFLFTALLFALATAVLYVHFRSATWKWLLFLLCMLPVVLFFSYWWYQVWHNEDLADFRHSLRMNLLATFCMTVYFASLILIRHFE